MQEFVKKLIERLEEREAELKTITAECKPTKEMKDKNYGYYTAMNQAKEIINQLAEEYESNLSENLTSLDGWIPCSERLPEEPKAESIDVEEMICLGKINEYNVMIRGASIATSLYYAGDGYWYDEVSQELLPVLAWQPLPSPYQPKGEQ